MLDTSTQEYEKTLSSKDESLPKIHKKRLQRFATPAEVAKAMPLSRAAMSELVGEVHGIKPKHISDSFVAKLFATAAFPLDLVVRGLGFLGVQDVGPLALREMALRAGSTDAFIGTLATLKQMKIKVSNALYCRLLRKLAADGQPEMFDALLANDQHPDSFEDDMVQDRLLKAFLHLEQWPMVHVTMMGRALAGHESEHRAWNELLQHYLETGSWHNVEQTWQSMQARKVHITHRTVGFMWRYALPERRKRHRPALSQWHSTDRPHFDALTFVTNAYMYASRHGDSVAPKVWVEMLKRYGMVYRLWPELEKLALWLGERYGTADSWEAIKKRQQGSVLPSDPFSTIFHWQMQQALFVWGFNNAAMMHRLRVRPLKLGGSDGMTPWEDWAQGLKLLKRLSTTYGVGLRTSFIRKAFLLRMKIIFSRRHTDVPVTRLIRRRNRLSFEQYVRQGCEIFGPRLTEPGPQPMRDGVPTIY
ncbi:hypothetical protein BAUCODRAFT_150291 [Baudoinia panamericana UAMH 10762]|uniref:Uncharacterized protein n=1 Tax=Baudoinia panamericana (strain UAMH 10762) TaxID=717646 RepID=M2N5N7_BAUPA|nr:uncharacterized protein BAUCODRAFT_150291 [Baudoinia panamericana UAMH 10762]EMC94070.1 hypothetical protein BAUCODRAFT_150291 [Baudoinia panamericana UAMH 10762]